MALKLTKVASGIAFGDVSNASIRNILTEISKLLYGKFTIKQLKETLDYFDWKCPYTGKDLRNVIENGESGYATDHIYPQNKDFCGLNVKGNLVIVDSEANKKKHDTDFETFMRDRRFDDLLGDSMVERERRIEKIKRFQQDCNYNPELIKSIVSPMLTARYEAVRDEQERTISDVIKQLNLAGISGIED